MSEQCLSVWYWCMCAPCAVFWVHTVIRVELRNFPANSPVIPPLWIRTSKIYSTGGTCRSWSRCFRVGGAVHGSGQGLPGNPTRRRNGSHPLEKKKKIQTKLFRFTKPSTRVAQIKFHRNDQLCLAVYGWRLSTARGFYCSRWSLAGELACLAPRYYGIDLMVGLSELFSWLSLHTHTCTGIAPRVCAKSVVANWASSQRWVQILWFLYFCSTFPYSLTLGLCCVELVLEFGGHSVELYRNICISKPESIAWNFMV